ncbi:MAG: hypothetical protein ABEJ36_04145 [Candidatus Nanosalina sp.]
MSHFPGHTGDMGTFGTLLGNMEQLGFFSGLLPFVITYTIFFFMLRKIGEEIFDADDNNRADVFSALLSIAFAFFTSKFIMAHPAFQDFFTQFLGRFTIVVVGLLALLVMISFVGIDLKKKNSVGWVLALLVIAAFAVSGGVRSLLPVQSRSEVIAALAGFLSFTIETGLIFVFLILGLLWWTMSEEEDDDEEGFFEFFESAMKGSGDES